MSFLKAMFGLSGPGDKKPAAVAPSAPPTAEALRSRGNDALAAGDLAGAAECYRLAAIADPRDALARLNLGFVLLEMGDSAAAVAQLSEALALRQPAQNIAHDIHYLLARAFRAQGDTPRAIASLKEAVAAMPGFAEALEDLVQLLHETQAHAEALECAQRLQAARPGIESDILVAQQLHHIARHADALAILDAVVQREPDHIAAWAGRGNVLTALNRVPESVDAFERVLTLTGPHPDALANSAGALSRANRFEEALQRAELALAQDPTHREALCNRLNTLLEMVRIDAAVDAGRQAVAAHPQDADIHWNTAIAYLLAGRFEEGWREHEWRWQATGSRARHPLITHGTQWTGAEDLNGRTILLFAEQGFGDSLQMLRYVPRVAARGGRVLLHLPVGLHDLVLTRELAPGVTLIRPGDPRPPFDFHCPLMSLPLAFGGGEAAIPREVPYLRVDAARLGSWQRRLGTAGGRLKVGVAWSGSATHANDSNRSLSLSQIRSIATPGCFFVSLQQQVREADRAAFAEWRELHRWGEELVDFDDTAALIQSLDLVISVDTSVAHLAGALGRPLWILLPHCPDWRWMVERSDSPWYPSARLFRQQRRGDWSTALVTIREELRQAVVRQVPTAETTLLTAPRPSWPELLERAQSELDDGTPERALETLDRADAQVGPHLLAHHLRGNAQFALGRYAEAVSAYDAALARKPDLAEAQANAAAALNRLGRDQDALQRVERSLQLRPDHVLSMSNRVIVLQSLGRYSEALAAAREAHLRFPEDAELRWNYGATALLLGDYAQGLPHLDARWNLRGAGQRPQAGELGCPVWTGAESVDGRTLLLVPEQGFGDTLQFVRYAPELIRRGARVVLWMPEALKDLVRASLPDCTVVTRRQDAPAADFHVPMMDLLSAMRTRLQSIPAAIPYLHAEPARVAAWRARLPVNNGLRVGLVWSGNAAHVNDRNRSLPLTSLLRIAVPGVRFVSLQREVREADRAALRDSGIDDVADELRSFADTAALVEALDLVISVDTSVAHLAGALGKPLWMLLPHRPDWRWLLDRDDSPWYPTARLFRQPIHGDWGTPTAAVRAALMQLAATGRASA